MTSCGCMTGLKRFWGNADSRLVPLEDSLCQTVSGPSTIVLDVPVKDKPCQRPSVLAPCAGDTATPSTGSPTSAQGGSVLEAGDGDYGPLLHVSDIPLIPVASFLSFSEVARMVLAGHDVLDPLSVPGGVQADASASVKALHRKLIVPIVEVKLETSDILQRVSTEHVQVIRVWSRLAFDEVRRILRTEGPRAFRALERASFKGCRVFGGDAEILSPLFAGSDKLSLANFEKNFMTDEVIVAFARHGTFAGARFDTLNLRFNQLSNPSASAIADVLRDDHPTIETVNLKANKVGDDGAVKLAEALTSNHKLRVLNLRRQFPGLTDVTATAMANALGRNSTLRKLRLRRNKVGDAGCVELAKALTWRCKRLWSRDKSSDVYFELDLEENKVGVVGALALLECLREVGPGANLEFLLFGNAGLDRNAVRQALIAEGLDPAEADDPRLQLEISKAEHLL
eukprot:CAMPEP_0169085214 /NCGR_PEP_ID=MMETSP1015-20121227/13036_1 /TAXON_ID=342587 /ORGANISM="Karlodinium micrum, Strain CCMP2283" /LENGTH=455 /DNA_ID=CAMNT_0009145277 /DNA_START=63 /DNA_END=1430 /DNA_ORIENTATION=-